MERDGAEVHAVNQSVPSSIDSDESANAVVLVFQQHAVSGEPFGADLPTFVTVWNRLRDGATLSRDAESE